MIRLAKLITERSSYQVYHRTATDAAQTAKELANQRGYQVDEDEWHSEVAMGGRYGRLRPSEGKTHKFNIALETQDGKRTGKALHFQIYGMESGKYELNAYIT